MVFSSLIFIFAFLPLTVAVYYVVPLKLRNLALFVLSLAFYGWGEPVYIALMLFSVSAAYAFGFGIEKNRATNKKRAKAFLVISLCVNLALLLFFKYYNFFAENLSQISFLSGIKTIEGLTLPVGISFYTFQIMSYSIDLYRGEVPLARRFVPFGTYVTLFPQLIAGPIVRYQDVCDQLTERKESVFMFSAGIERFCCGLAKKLLLGDAAATAAEYFRASAAFEGTVSGGWLTVLFYTFHIYFDFSGYSDMAIGLGKMFGFRFVENFNYPYISKSITEFWRRWHITLSTWFREYVYIPLGGNRRGKGRQYFNIAVVWLLTGFWHGADWNYILWGLYFCIILVCEKAFLLKTLERHPAVGHIYSLVLIGIGWLIFFYSDMGELSAAFLRLFGIGAELTDATVGYDFLRLLPLIAVCAFGCTPYPGRLWAQLRARFPKFEYAVPFATVLLFLICVAYMVDNSFSPFLYYIF